MSTLLKKNKKTKKFCLGNDQFYLLGLKKKIHLISMIFFNFLGKIVQVFTLGSREEIYNTTLESRLFSKFKWDTEKRTGEILMYFTFFIC